MSVIENFFNPRVVSNELVFYNTNKALQHCKDNYSYIRHYSFKSNEYIKYDGKNLIWNDGNKVDIEKLPNCDGWGKYFSELHNRCSF